MSNVFKQAQIEIKRFKTKYIAPGVLEEMAPKLRADYVNAMEEYRKSDAYKKVTNWHAKHHINSAVRDFFQGEKFQKRIAKIIEKEVLKEIVNGDK